MKFFKKKAANKISSKVEAAIAEATEATLDGAGETATICDIDLKKSNVVDAPIDAIIPQTTEREAEQSDSMHLFPGFEGEAFSIGYNVQDTGSVLMMRWDNNGDAGWFEVPAMFNNAVIAKIQERENEKDLGRLLRDYGYDVDQTSQRKAAE